MINTLLRLACLVCYSLALIGQFGILSAEQASRSQLIALSLVFMHVLELAFAFKYIRRYPGGVNKSILLTLLFGVLHWKPLAREYALEKNAK